MTKRRSRKKKVKKSILKNSLLSTLSRIYPVLIIFSLGIIIYSNSFYCSFHFDDLHSIINNEAIRDLRNVKEIWNYGFHSKLRFVGFYTFALNYHFHQLDVFGYHVVNTLIHIGASIFAWWLVTLILSTPVMKKEAISKYKSLIALGCSLLFLSHPLQTQAVTYIVQRFASLAALFSLASLCFYLKARQTDKKSHAFLFFSGSALMALLGMFTKEIVFTLPFVVLLLELGFNQTGSFTEIIRNKKVLKYMVPVLLFILVIPLMLLLTTINYKYIFETVQSDKFQDPPLTSSIYLMTQFRVISKYIQMLFFPMHQNLDHDFPASGSFFELSTFAGFVFLAFLIIFALWIFPRRRLEASGILWFFLTIFVESSIKPLKNVMFEHRLYFPLFGYSLIFMSMLYHVLWKKYSKTAIIVFLIVLSYYSFSTYERNKVWRNDYTLWSDTAKKSPNKARPHNNLGNALYRQGKIKEAVEKYRSALNVNPDYSESHNNMGNALSMLGKYKEAVEHYHNALRLTPYDVEIHINLGTALFLFGKYEEAAVKFHDITTLWPNYSNGHVNLGDVLYHQEKYEEAAAAYRKAAQIDSSDADVYNKLGTALYRQEKFDEAIFVYNKALQIDPGYTKTYNNLGIVFYSQGKYEEAVELYRSALRIDPDYSKAHVNLGEALNNQGNIKEAVAEYRRALQIDPNYIKAYVNLGDAFYHQEKYEEAIGEYFKALQVNPNIADIHNKLGVALSRLGKLDRAAEHFKNALAIDSDFKEAQYNLKIVLKKQARQKQPNPE